MTQASKAQIIKTALDLHGRQGKDPLTKMDRRSGKKYLTKALLEEGLNQLYRDYSNLGSEEMIASLLNLLEENGFMSSKQIEKQKKEIIRATKNYFGKEELVNLDINAMVDELFDSQDLERDPDAIREIIREMIRDRS